MSNNSVMYMTTEEYLKFIHSAHTSYMVSRENAITAQGRYHLEDIVINSAEFFEVSYHLVGALGEVHMQRTLAERQELKDLEDEAAKYVSRGWQQTLFDALDEQQAVNNEKIKKNKKTKNKLKKDKKTK
jgi:hypothetical protein